MRAGQQMTPEQRERISRITKEAMNRPEVKERISKSQKKACARPEVKERRSRASKEARARPEIKERMSRAAKEACARPEVKERRSRAAKEACARPEVKERRKEAWASPEVRERQSRAVKEACARPKVKEKRCRASKENMAKPEVRKKISASLAGPKSSNWKGGISFEPYCPKFTRQLKDEIRAAFGYKCYLCPHIQNGRRLSIHHVDYDKNDICNGKKWPLIPLCTKCHAKTNHNRWYWFNLLMNYWAMNPEINFSSLATVPACEQA